MLKSNLFQSIIVFFVKLGAGFGGYLFFIIASQYLGAKEFGTFSITFSVCMLIAMFGSCGQQVFLMKQVPKEQALGSKEHELGSYYFSFFITFFFSLISVIVFFIYQIYYNNSILETWLWSGGIFCMVYSISEMTIGALRIQDKSIFAVFTRDLLWRTLSILGILMMSWGLTFKHINLNAGIILFIMLITLIPIIIIHIFYIIKHIKQNFKMIRPQYRFVSWFETSFGFALIAFISNADFYIYTIILGELLPPIEAGVFFASLKTVELLNLFFITVTLVIAPQLSKLIASGDYIAIQKKCNSATILQGVPILIFGVIILLFAPYFLKLFNDDFVPYANLLRILTIVKVFTTITGTKGLLMQLSGIHWQQVVYQGTGIIISLILLFPLVDYFGVMGAVLSFIISKTIWNIGAVNAIRKKLNVDPSFIALFTQQSGSFKEILGELKPFINKLKKGKINAGNQRMD